MMVARSRLESAASCSSLGKSVVGAGSFTNSRNLRASYQLEDRRARCGSAKRVGRRSGGDVEETLNLRLEAIEEGLDHFGLVGVGEFTHHQGFGTRASSQHDVTTSAR